MTKRQARIASAYFLCGAGAGVLTGISAEWAAGGMLRPILIPAAIIALFFGAYMSDRADRGEDDE